MTTKIRAAIYNFCNGGDLFAFYLETPGDIKFCYYVAILVGSYTSHGCHGALATGSSFPDGVLYKVPIIAGESCEACCLFRKVTFYF